jgi:diguanylate cyclase (GGDEF)-like protein
VTRTRPIRLPPWPVVAWTALATAFAAYAAGALGLVGPSDLALQIARDALLVVGAAMALAGALRRDSDRGAFVVLALALGLWAVGQLVWSLAYSGMAEPPFPSWSDACWIACYPLYYVALTLLARRRLRSVPGGAWLDGLIGGLALSAVTLAVLLEPLRSMTGGSLGQVVTTLSYPILDVVLIGVLVGLLALAGWREGRGWALLAAGMVLNVAADWSYIFVASSGAYAAFVDVLFGAAALCLAGACWQPLRPATRVGLGAWVAIAPPLTAMVVSAFVLTRGSLSSVSHAASALPAVGALLLGLVRVVLTYRENLQLAASRREALTDDLTGIANRRHLLRELHAALTPSDDGTLAGSTLMLIDLDRFKDLNDTFGHAAGDDALAEVAARLRRAAGQALVARVGGDEFALLLEGTDRGAALDMAAAVQRGLLPPFAVGGRHGTIGASIGIAMAPDHAIHAADLLRCADVAMYEAKRAGAGTRVSSAAGAGALAAELRRALDGGELELHYQPQAEMESHRICGVEALVRWRHPQDGLLAPGAFLPAIREAGLSRRLTLQVLEAALAQARAWDAEEIDVPIAVNVSADDVLDPHFPAEVEQLIQEAGVAPQRLRLEITETAPVADLALAGTALRRLRAAGVAVALDDFGTGYSSLSYLRQLDLDELKIDRSFVAGATADPAAGAIVRATVDLAHTLGLRVVAEGIEDAHSWQLLEALGCDVAQGYLLARPMPADELTTWLRGRTLVRTAAVAVQTPSSAS